MWNVPTGPQLNISERPLTCPEFGVLLGTKKGTTKSRTSKESINRLSKNESKSNHISKIATVLLCQVVLEPKA